MEFYEEFADKYDSLVSFENRIKRESNFFKKIFIENNVKSILDCACGTGHHVLMFNQMNFHAKGSDLSKKMIEKAKSNSQKYGINAQFIVADFKNLTKKIFIFDRSEFKNFCGAIFKLFFCLDLPPICHPFMRHGLTDYLY